MLAASIMFEIINSLLLEHKVIFFLSQNIRVIGASEMPKIPSANLNAPELMIVKKKDLI